LTKNVKNNQKEKQRGGGEIRTLHGEKKGGGENKNGKKPFPSRRNKQTRGDIDKV